MNVETLARHARNAASALGAAALVAVLAAGCGSETSSSGEPDSTDATETAEPAVLEVEDSWAKAVNEGMTAVFGTLVNEGESEVRVMSASSPVAGMTELHEVVSEDGEQKMRPKEDGFVVPAGDKHLLEPGADHVMLMELTEPLKPGDTVDVELTLESGAAYEFTAQVKEFAGADENYRLGGDESAGGADE